MKQVNTFSILSRHLRVTLSLSFWIFGFMTLLAQSYVIDGREVYYGDRLLVEADANSFRILGQGYAKDQRTVYFEGRVLPFVDPSTFRLLPSSQWRHGRDGRHSYGRFGRYYRTSNNVYYNGKKLDASPNSFVELGEGYAKDAFSVFMDGRKLSDATPSSFKLLGGGYAKDSFNVYYDGKKMADASSQSFEYDGDGYAHDAFYDYYLGRRLSD